MIDNRIIIAKNAKISDDYWLGRLISAGSSYQLEPVERDKWKYDPKVITDMASGDLVINDGTDDLSASQGKLWVTADFLLEVEDPTAIVSKFVEHVKFDDGLITTSLSDSAIQVEKDGGTGLDTYNDVLVYGNSGTAGDAFLHNAANDHTSMDSCPIALADGEVVHVTISTEKDPINIWELQIVINATKSGSGTLSGGTQIGIDLKKPSGQLDIVYKNLTGFAFSEGDRIQAYAKKNPNDAVEPVVRVFVRYS